ncbi:MAG: formylglycine-generating enzyme family protein [Pirellula sp.]|nr:formylglycine-generating enzyme family protein [Pirellula sp.]
MFSSEIDAAIARLEQGLAGAESANRVVLYNLARAVALFAASEMATVEEKRIWTNQAIALLELWSQNNEQHPYKMHNDPDLIVLHGDPRFFTLATERINVRELPYWLASREVTRGEYEAFLDDTIYDGEKPKHAADARPDDEVSPTPDHPAQHVSWYDAVMYCNWLSRREGRTPAYRYTGKEKIKDYRDREIEVDKWEELNGATGYRLPTEVEWEYACEAGSLTDWSTGSDMSLLVGYFQMYRSELAASSGKKLPNAWGMHDMHGNVWEWCWDLDDSLSSDRVYRVSCGGCWLDDAARCRTSDRNSHVPTVRTSSIGFRLALSPSSQSREAEKEKGAEPASVGTEGGSGARPEMP